MQTQSIIIRECDWPTVPVICYRTTARIGLLFALSTRIRKLNPWIYEIKRENCVLIIGTEHGKGPENKGLFIPIVIDSPNQDTSIRLTLVTSVGLRFKFTLVSPGSWRGLSGKHGWGIWQGKNIATNPTFDNGKNPNSESKLSNSFRVLTTTYAFSWI